MTQMLLLCTGFLMTLTKLPQVFRNPGGSPALQNEGAD
jgi:hypothetical protein